MTEPTDLSSFTDDANGDADSGGAADADDAPTDNPYVSGPDLEFAPVDDLDAETAREQAALDEGSDPDPELAALLREAVRYHDHRYYVQADPVVSDRAYDRLFARLQELESAFDLDTDGSPTERVGGEPVDAFDTVEHVAPMLSIESSGEAAEVREFAARVGRSVGE